MADIARTLVSGIGFDDSMFNIEMFYNGETDAIHIIEINPRMSYQFADMFEKVDGTNSYALQLQLCQGERPEYENGLGRYGVAVSFVLRLFENKMVTRVPSDGELRRIQEQYPDSLVVIKVSKGFMLSDLSQDESSYRYAIINLGGRDWPDVYARFEEIKRQLVFEFEPPVTKRRVSERHQGLLSKFKTVGFFDERDQMIRQVRDFFATSNKHRIRACIMFGTLLGKLRHNDFIPWDDDVDIIIFDYDAFIDRCAPELERQGYIIEPDIRDGKRMGCRIFHIDGAVVPGQPRLLFPWIGIYEHEVGNDGLIMLPPEEARYRPEDFLPLKRTDFLGIPVGIPRDSTAILNTNFKSEDWMNVCQLPYRNHRNGNVPTGFPDDKFELQSVLDYLASESLVIRSDEPVNDAV
jgi:hypothetical protein